MKTCTRCGESKPLDAFKTHRRSAGGRYSMCRPCDNSARKANRIARRAALLVGIPADFDTARFWSFVEKTDACWTWTGRVNHEGYGSLASGEVNLRAHRVAFVLTGGVVPPGMQIDHLCRNRLCVNPAHLEAVTPRENALRSACPAAINAQKTRCKKGHPFDAMQSNGKRGIRRVCTTCSRERSRRRWDAEKARAA